MRPRTDLIAAALLTVLAAGVTSTSATLALRGAGGAATGGPAARLPDVLFSPDPTGPVAPVRLDPTTGLDVPGDDSVRLAAPLPTPRPSPQPRPTKTAKAPAAPAPAVPRLAVNLAFVESREQGRVGITYTASIRNDGPSALQGLVLKTHVPTGTRWRADAPCRGESRPLRLGYGDGSPIIVCVPAPRKVGDGSSHEVVAVFDRPIPPGATATATYTVRVERWVASVQNHVHVDGAGIHADSPPLSTTVS